MTDLCYIEDETYNVIAVLFYVVAMAIVRRWFSYVTGLIRRYVAEKGKALHLRTCTVHAVQSLYLQSMVKICTVFSSLQIYNNA